MARTGRFGRSPRSAPSLTSTLVAIAREWQNQRAQNIMDAWQKGGMFEGKKATDSVVLAFWKAKAAGVSKDDPLYDTYKNAHTQLDYTIHESKMTAWYATSKKGDAENRRMVGFYLGWAKKVPKDSEFYRVLQRDAGQYMRVQRAASKADANRLKELRYQKQQAATQAKYEAAGEFLIETLRRVAQSGRSDLGIPQAIAGPGSGSDFTGFDPEDPSVMLRLIDAITPSERVVNDATGFVTKGDAKPTEGIVYHNDDGVGITGVQIIEQLQKLDPNYKPGQPLNTEYVTGVLATQKKGLNERMERALETGHMTDYNSLQKSKAYVATVEREIAAYPVQTQYMEERADYDRVMNDPYASPAAKAKADQQWRTTLHTLAASPNIVADDALRSRLTAEANGTGGVPSLKESFTGLADGQFDPNTAQDIEFNKARADDIRADIDAVAQGTAVWTFGNKDPQTGVFTPAAGGRSIGAATEAAAAAGGQNMQYVTVPDPQGGAPLTVAVTAIPIYATAKHPVTGEPLDATNQEPIGFAYDIPSGGQTTTQYSFPGQGGAFFTADPVFGDHVEAKGFTGGNFGTRLEIDLSADVAASLGYGDKDPLTGEWRIKPDPNALNVDARMDNGIIIQAGTEYEEDGVTLKPPTIAFAPSALAWSSGTRGQLGTTDPQTDFHSLTLSTLMSTPEGRNALGNIKANDAYSKTMTDDAYRASGAEFDWKTGTYIPGTGDVKMFGQAVAQQNLASNAKSLGGFFQSAAALFTRDATGSPNGKSDLDWALPDLKPLATDVIKGTPFEALGNVFMPKTSNIKPVVDPRIGKKGVEVVPVKALKLPSVSTQLSILGQQPTQTSSQPVTTTTQTGSTPPPQTGSIGPTPTPGTGSYGGGGGSGNAGNML